MSEDPGAAVRVRRRAVLDAPEQCHDPAGVAGSLRVAGVVLQL